MDKYFQEPYAFRDPKSYKSLDEYPLYIDSIPVTDKYGFVDIGSLSKCFPLTLNQIQKFRLKQSTIKEHALMAWASIFIEELKIDDALEYYYKAIIRDDSIVSYEAAKTALRSNGQIMTLNDYVQNEKSILRIFLLVRSILPADKTKMNEDWGWAIYVLAAGFGTSIDRVDALYGFLAFSDLILMKNNCSMGFIRDKSSRYADFLSRRPFVVKSINESILTDRGHHQPQEEFPLPIFTIAFFKPFNSDHFNCSQLFYLISSLTLSFETISKNHEEKMDLDVFTYEYCLEAWKIFTDNKLNRIQKSKKDPPQSLPGAIPKRPSLISHPPNPNLPALNSSDTHQDSSLIYSPDEGNTDLGQETPWVAGSQAELLIKTYLEKDPPKMGDALFLQSPTLLSYIIDKTGATLPFTDAGMKGFLENQLKVHYESLWPIKKGPSSFQSQASNPKSFNIQSLAEMIQDLHTDLKIGFQTLNSSSLGQMSANIDSLVNMMASSGNPKAVSTLQSPQRTLPSLNVAQKPLTSLSTTLQKLSYPPPIASTSAAMRNVTHPQDSERQRIIKMMLDRESQNSAPIPKRK